MGLMGAPAWRWWGYRAHVTWKDESALRARLTDTKWHTYSTHAHKHIDTPVNTRMMRTCASHAHTHLHICIRAHIHAAWLGYENEFDVQESSIYFIKSSSYFSLMIQRAFLHSIRTTSSNRSHNRNLKVINNLSGGFGYFISTTTTVCSGLKGTVPVFVIDMQLPDMTKPLASFIIFWYYYLSYYSIVQQQAA
jgi:hypothetical protein